MPHKPSVLVAHADIIGVLPDKQVGEIAGCTPSRVRQWRIQHSIPARWRGETSMPSTKSMANEEKRRAAKQVHLTPDQEAAVTVIAEAVHSPVPVDVRMSTSNAFVWTITLKDTDAALGEVELPGENEVMVVASDAVGAAQAALVLGTVIKIEMKFKVLLASDICPV